MPIYGRRRRRQQSGLRSGGARGGVGTQRAWPHKGAWSDEGRGLPQVPARIPRATAPPNPHQSPPAKRGPRSLAGLPRPHPQPPGLKTPRKDARTAPNPPPPPRSLPVPQCCLRAAPTPGPALPPARPRSPGRCRARLLRLSPRAASGVALCTCADRRTQRACVAPRCTTGHRVHRLPVRTRGAAR